MADIRLRDYVARIREMIRGDQHDEAIAHCQHILKYYPKHIETYCLLGEACLEREMVRESIEFFQRTLSADPESFIARVGMGIIYESQGLIDEAVWQMERAFELVPGNAEVRQELQRLYLQRDGKEKTRLKLTRGALGRLYCRNGLYERAITEFRAVLRQEPDLPDVRVALIEALWREGRRLEAVEACLELLDALPNCLKANLILAEIWMRGGHEDASGEKLNLARALDPENLVAQEMMGRDSPLPPEDIFIPELDYARSMALAAVAESEMALSWGLEGEEAETALGEPLMLGDEEEWETGEGLPDWLVDIGVTEMPESEVARDAEVLEEEAVLPEELPDWLAGIAEDETVIISHEEVPSVTGEVVAAADTISEDRGFDWSADLAEDEVEGAPGEEQALDEEAVPARPIELRESEAEEAAEPAVADALKAAGAVAAGAVLAAEMSDQLEDRQGLDAEVGEPEAEIPDWLREIQEPGEEAITLPVVDMPPDEEVPLADMPDWLRELQPSGADERTIVEEDLSVAEDVLEAEEIILPVVGASLAEEIPDWLRDLDKGEPGAGEASAALPPSADEAPGDGIIPETDVPDWLRVLSEPGEDRLALADEEEIASMQAEAVSPEGKVPQSLQALVDAGILDEADLDTAMAEMSPEELEVQRIQDVPVWLRDLMDEQGPPEELAPTEPVAAMPEEIPPETGVEAAVKIPSSADEVPDWLQELEGEPSVVDVRRAAGIAAAGAVVAAEVPDWLKELEEPAAEETVPLEAVAPPEEVSPVAEGTPARDVPPSLLALVEAGILDASDLDTAIAEMSDEDLEAQQSQDVPVWLRELMEEEEVAHEPAPLEAGEPVAGEPPVVEIATEETAEEVPAWLQELAEPVVEETVSPEAEELAAAETSLLDIPEDESAEEIPAWLREIEVPVVEEIQPLEVEEVVVGGPSLVDISDEEAVEEMPAWLRELETPDVEEVMAPEEEEPLPAWLREFEQGEEEVASLQDQVLEAVEEAPPGVEMPEEEPLPAWLREFEDLEREVAPPTAKVPPVVAAAAAKEVPASLRALVEAGILDEADLESAMAEMSDEDLEDQRSQAVPEWLHDLMGEEPLPPDVAAPEGMVPAVEDLEPSPVLEMKEEPPPSEDIGPAEEEAPEPVVETPAEMPVAEEPLPAVTERVPGPVVEQQVPSVEEEAAPVEEPSLPPAEMEMVAPFERVEIEEELAPPSPIEELVSLLASHPRDYRARLELAQAYQAEEDWNAALGQYEKLVSARKFLPVVIDQLQAMANEEVNRPRLFQVLGDAYMNEDKLEAALDMYRQARQALAKR